MHFLVWIIKSIDPCSLLIVLSGLEDVVMLSVIMYYKCLKKDTVHFVGQVL